MNCLILQNFLNTISRADAIVLIKDSTCELIYFNDHITEEKHQQFLKREMQNASFAHLENIAALNGDSSTYIESLLGQFKEALLDFFDFNSFLIHRNLSILDTRDHLLLFDDLPVEVKHKISSFISVQKSCLNYFLSKHDNSGSHSVPSHLKWNESITAFVELSNVLYEGGIIVSENGAITKKEFMLQFAKLLGVQINSWEKKLNKAMLRENPATFIDRLKSILLDYCKKILT
jgi:hypothetical protein